jgi:glycosyltransferase involved in cell wall biosynthesis
VTWWSTSDTARGREEDYLGVTLLSVVLPNYNHARYLPRALDAILHQARPADEVIVVDDGSTDESLLVLKQYADHHPSVAIVAQERNLGAVAALNTGLSKATGRYVYMAAADDVVMPCFFELGLSALERHPGLGLFTGTTVLHDGPTGHPAGRRPAVWPRYSPGVVSPDRAAGLLRRSDNWILTGASLLLTDAIEEAGGLAADLGSFADGFLVRKIALSRGFYFHPRPVAVWNIHKDSVSRRTATQPEEAVRALGLYTERIRADPVFPTGYAERFGRRWRFAAARISLQLPVEERAVIEALALQKRLDREVLVHWAPRLPDRLSTRASLCWLYLRLRPTTLTGVVSTWVVARLPWSQKRLPEAN